MRALVDTNVIVEAVVEDADMHEEALRIVEGIEGLVIPLIVLYELAWVFRKLGIGASHLSELYDALLTDPRVEVVAEDPGDLRAASRYIAGHGLSLARFNDEVIARTALRLSLPLVTFDEGLARRAARLGVRILRAPK